VTRRISPIVAVLAGLALGGATPAAAARPLTRHALDVRANAICAAADQAARTQPGVADVAAWLPVFTPAGLVIANRTLAQLKGLEPPQALRKLWRRYRLGLRHEINLSVRAFALLAAGQQAAQAALIPEAASLAAADKADAGRLGTTCSR
jgi:hypothetical protein